MKSKNTIKFLLPFNFNNYSNVVTEPLGKTQDGLSQVTVTEPFDFAFLPLGRLKTSLVEEKILCL